jgi:flagellar biosynthesis protein FlhF
VPAVASLQVVAARFEPRLKSKQAEKPEVAVALDAGEVQQLKSEVEDLRILLGEVATQLKYSRMPSLPEHLKEAYAKLVNQDVDEGLASEIVQSIYAKFTEEQLSVGAEVERTLLKSMEGILKTDEMSKPGRRTSKVIALVGPTGVGKTTTVAKLAAIAKLIKQKDVALISADTYRIGAIQQLRSFAAIANIPMEVVYEPADMEAALLRFNDKDIIFVDTVGRSQRDEKELSDLTSFVHAAMPDEVHLVLSVSTDQRTLCDVIDRFKVMSPDYLLFTKLDEAVSFGSVLNTAKKFGLAISYITTGQNVPDDIRQARSTDLASLVYTGVLPNA